jgi:hypothetical protein
MKEIRPQRHLLNRLRINRIDKASSRIKNIDISGSKPPDFEEEIRFNIMRIISARSTKISDSPHSKRMRVRSGKTH